MIKVLLKPFLLGTCMFVLSMAVLPVLAAASPLSEAVRHQPPQFIASKEPLLITHTLYLPAVFSSNTVPFDYGVQPDPRGNTAANIGHVKTLGMGWVKFQMAWKDVEILPGDYDWALWDDVIGTCSAERIQVMLTVTKAPDWARPPDDDKSVEGLPTDPTAYAAFVTQVASRYQGQVQAIEVWAEQNLWYAVGGQGRINVTNYVQLLRVAHQAIKTVDPNIMIISGGLTPAANVGALAMDDMDYLGEMYARGARSYFDAVGAHPAGYLCPALADWRTVTPEEATADPDHGTFTNRHHSWCFLGTMEGYRNVMVAHGDSAKKIIPTEFGWAVTTNPQPGYEYARSNTYEEQARWIVEAFQWGKRQGWVGPMILWNLDYGVTTPGIELASFSLLVPGGVVPAYTAIVNMHSAPDNESLINIDLSPEDTYQVSQTIPFTITVSNAIGVDKFDWGVFKGFTTITGGMKDCFGAVECEIAASFSPGITGVYSIVVEAINTAGNHTVISRILTVQ